MESGRFKQLYQLKEELYTEGGPVIIEKGALLLDTKSNKLLIQLKFCNIAEKPFKALYISFNTYDTSNVQMSPIEYKYLDIDVDYGKSFGADKAIILENNLVRSFEISKYSVVYEDNEIQTFSDPFLQLPDADLLQTKFADEELIKQYCIETSKYSQYVPIQYKSIWKCACGKWNSKNICWNCKGTKRTIFDKLTDSELSANKEKRLEQEKINKEIQEKRRAQTEKEEQIKKKRIRNVIIAGSVLVVSGILYTSFVQPYITYQHGKKLLSEKKYDDAIVEFAKVDGYKDSKSMIDDSYYQKGASLLEEKKFDEAEEIFESLNNYKMMQETKRQKGIYLLNQKEYDAAKEIFKDLDDSEMCNEVDYQRALDYVTQEEYDKAIILFKWLKNHKYKDSEEQYNEVTYQEGVKFMDAENYSSASAVFQNIKDYKDALSKWGECQYLLGMEEISKKKYDKAIEYFENVLEKDTTSENKEKVKEQINECYYQNGLSLMEKEEYQKAVDSFSNIKDYKDAKDKMQFCENAFNKKNVETLFPTIKFGVSPKKVRKEFGEPSNTSTIDATPYRKEQFVYSYPQYCEISGIPGTLSFKFERKEDNNRWGLMRVEWKVSSKAFTPEAYEVVLKCLEKSWGKSVNTHDSDNPNNLDEYLINRRYYYNNDTNEIEDTYNKTDEWKERNYIADYDNVNVYGQIKKASICVSVSDPSY